MLDGVAHFIQDAFKARHFIVSARLDDSSSDGIVLCSVPAEAAGLTLEQDLYLEDKKENAAAAIPGSFFEEASLVGAPGFVRDRIAEYRESGVTSLNVDLIGRTLDERLRTLAALRELIATT